MAIFYMPDVVVGFVLSDSAVWFNSATEIDFVSSKGGKNISGFDILF